MVWWNLFRGGGVCTLNSCLTFNNYNWQYSFPLKYYTIDFWFKATSIGSNSEMFASCPNTGNWFKVYCDSSNFMTKVRSIPSITDWHRYTYSCNNGSYKFYIDGILHFQGNASQSNLLFFVGANDPWYGGGYMHGQLKPVALYSKSIMTEFDKNEKFNCAYNNLYGDNDNLYGYKKK